MIVEAIYGEKKCLHTFRFLFLFSKAFERFEYFTDGSQVLPGNTFKIKKFAASMVLTLDGSLEYDAGAWSELGNLAGFGIRSHRH